MVNLPLTCPLCTRGELVDKACFAKCDRCGLELCIDTTYIDLRDYIASSEELHRSSCNNPVHFRLQMERYIIMYCSCGFYDCDAFIAKE